MAASSLVFFILTLLIGSFTIVADAGPNNTRVLGEEYGLEEIEKQLNAINKPAIKSFKTDRGDILDCVDINKQLAFDHPLLKNHTIQLVPNMVSKRNKASRRFECPHGTVIIKRSTKQDLLSAHKMKVTGFRSLSSKTNGRRPNGHHSAGLGYRAQVSEASGRVNVWAPQVSPRQFSLARVLVSRQTNSIQAGWQVNPAQYEYTRFYTYWTADGYKKRGCFDMQCPGFVQVSRTNPLGTYVYGESMRDRRQYYIHVMISRDPVSGNWWLFFDEEAIGYWPKQLFTAQGLAQVASYASWGGEVYSPIGEKSPPMGSGSFAQEMYKRAACVNDIKVSGGFYSTCRRGRVTDSASSLTRPVAFTTALSQDSTRPNRPSKTPPHGVSLTRSVAHHYASAFAHQVILSLGLSHPNSQRVSYSVCTSQHVPACASTTVAYSVRQAE